MYDFSQVRFLRVSNSSIGLVRFLRLIVNSPSKERANYFYYRGVSASAMVGARVKCTQSSGLRRFVLCGSINGCFASGNGHSVLQSSALLQNAYRMGTSGSQRVGVMNFVRGLLCGLQAAFSGYRNSRYPMANVKI